MKKLYFVLLAVAALVTLGCPPSEAVPGETLEEGEYDFIIKDGGNYSVPVTDFTITEGNEYTVTFLIEGADEDFFPSRVGGKLIYKLEGDDTDYVLSGWTWSTPTPVTGPGTYRWNFKAGQKNEDSQAVAVPATTPDGAKQYFTLNAQDNSWNQYPAHYEFKIKGSIKVAEKAAPVGTKTNSGEITRTYDGADHDESIGKGNIEGDQFEKVKAAAGNGAFLRFYITDCNVDQKAGEDGNGVGSVGNRSEFNPEFQIPKGTQANPNFSFEVDIEISVLLEFVGASDNYLFVNMWGDGPAKCSKIELWEYK